MFLCAPIVLAAQYVDSTAILQVDSLIQVSRALTEKQDFDKAVEINVAAEKIALEKLGQESAAYGRCCISHGRVLYIKGDYPEAEKWYIEGLSIQEKVLGKEVPEYANSLYKLGTLYHITRNFEKAEAFYLEAKAIREKVLGKEHPDYDNSLNNLSILYYDMGNYEKAEPLYLEIKTLREKVLGKEHPDYAQSLLNLGVFYDKIGNYEKTEAFYLEALAIREKVLGKEHSDYAWSLYNLANLYLKLGKYEKAEPLYLESIAIREKISGKEAPAYAQGLFNLAILYSNMGEFEKAEPLFLESLAIKGKVFGKEHPSYENCLNNLGAFYHEMGNYQKSEQLFLEAKVICEKLHGKERPEYAYNLHNLAGLYSDMGYYKKAESFYLEALNIFEKVQGKEDPDYANCLNNLGADYHKMGNYKKSEPFFLEALAIREKVLGKEHPYYAFSLTDLGLLYTDLREYEKAEPLFLEALALREKVLGKENHNYASSLYVLAVLYTEMGNYKKAEPLLLESLAIREKVLGKENPEYAKCVNNLGILYIKTQQYKKAAAYFLEENKINRQNIERAASYSSENQMLQYLATFNKSLATFQSFTQLNPSPECYQENYNNSLFFNGLVLENERLLARVIASADTATIALYEKWQNARLRLAKRYAKPIAERKKIAETEAEAEGYEKALMRSLPTFGETRSVPQWQEVRDRLKPGEAAIEFVHYKFYTPDATDSVMYAALLLQPGWDAPQMIPLFEEKQLDSLLRNTGGDKADYITKVYAVASRSIVPVEKSSIVQYKSLYKLIWKPLEKDLAGAQSIYFAPTGLLHRLNLSAIPITADSTLADRYCLIELGSTRSLAERTKSRQMLAKTDQSYHNLDAAIFGGIQYEMDSTAIFAANARLLHADIASRGMENADSLDSSNRGGTWNYLNGTEKEVNVLASILTSAGFATDIRKGFDATEESFKNIGALQGDQKGSPRVIHLATHGFFFPDPQDTIKNRATIDEQETGFKTSDNPLIRSGLLMAGANYAWKTGKPIKKGMENGILTAYEISHLDLSQTELVVLSACETGLGDIAGNEGVFGLQRAFKIAGVRYLIMSLWQVPDFQTQDLMTTFYTYWLKEKKGIPEAFRAAQQDMREKYLDPYLWAGFVLVE